MNYLKIDDIDSFRFEDFITIDFTNIDDCIKICKKHNLNVFIINWDLKKVYFRNKTIMSCIENILYVKGSTMIIYDSKNNAPELYEQMEKLKYDERINVYYKKSVNLKFKNNKFFEDPRAG